ncbi:MAG: class I SAM-dependent RNA methyltransferase [Phycisphaerae bacterium]|nr:class I SAM-dependent RNA methyltransferase [Phycisphaerae bacterium]
MDLHSSTTIRIACAPGLAPLLEAEVRLLGCPVTAVDDTGLNTNGTLIDAMRLNLHLRTAFYVLYLIDEFPCETPEDLYRHVSFIEWENWLPADGYLSIISRTDTPAINNWTYATMKAKDAIVDRMAEKSGRRPDSGPERDRFVINLYWRKDRCWVYLNTSGQKLSDRSYRRIPHKAPMQEALAAGVILSTGYDGSMPLVNPMCGSGTLAIEAALIATNRAPGLLRGNFGFMHTLGFDAGIWEQLRAEARKQRSKSPPAPIIATDIDEAALQAARKNAMTAGVEHLIQFERCDFADTPLPPSPGMVILNPEYGERMGQVDELQGTYRRIGDFFKQRCPGWTGYVFTGNMDLAKKIGLKASRRTPFFNAKIECRLLKYELYEGSRRKDEGGRMKDE